MQTKPDNRDLSDSLSFNDEELQSAFNLAYVLHPHEEVALLVTSQACEMMAGLKKLQARRGPSSKPHKTRIPERNLLHYAILEASYFWEKDQESPHPSKLLPYTPTREDKIVRYIKHIFWQTSLHSVCFVGIGVGCHLYRYQPNDIAEMAMGCFDQGNIRRVKKWVNKNLKQRFRGQDIFGKEWTAASPEDRILVESTLKVLTPTFPKHVPPATPDSSILEVYFNPDLPVGEMERIHVLTDPHCAGIAYLIGEYNGMVGREKRLQDPATMLVLPKFNGTPSDPMHRFNPSALGQNVKSLIRMLNSKDVRRKVGSYSLDRFLTYFGRRIHPNNSLFIFHLSSSGLKLTD